MLSHRHTGPALQDVKDAQRRQRLAVPPQPPGRLAPPLPKGQDFGVPPNLLDSGGDGRAVQDGPADGRARARAQGQHARQVEDVVDARAVQGVGVDQVVGRDLVLCVCVCESVRMRERMGVFPSACGDRSGQKERKKERETK
jgi:hypothetical protein